MVALTAFGTMSARRSLLVMPAISSNMSRADAMDVGGSSVQLVALPLVEERRGIDDRDASVWFIPLVGQTL